MEYKNNVTLRQRKRKGVTALYLDITYKGTRKQESLKLYLVPEVTREDKRKNKDTLALAETLRAKKLTMINEKSYGLESEKDIGLYDFYDSLENEKRQKGWNYGWNSCRKHLKKYEPRNIPLSDIDAEWVRGFWRYLECEAISTQGRGCKRITQNTAAVYYAKLKTTLRAALRRGIIRLDPSSALSGPKKQESSRQYLTQEELQRLIDTPNGNDYVRKAFLFSCLTGLRRSDILKMKWSEVREENGMARIQFRAKKTKVVQYLDVNEVARGLMGERGNPDDPVFGYIGSPSSVNSNLDAWVARAGIDKKITFHCARHTFATLLLTLDTDLYTVSKLLGHQNISATQIYAKIVDEKRREAVNKLSVIKIER